ncbi:MAG: tetratricopeptide repeat protein, partial [Chloroflexi bacterium]|nr:tetratricopeptide repeat protein [Chloroflexota bacterium]
ALKRVTSSERLRLPMRSPGGDAQVLRLALAREFRTLASLRHPNIVSVLDYGFDGPHLPYFTMDYLPNASHLLAAPAQHVGQKVGYLIDVLQALAYLHRHDVLHRDLKPGNVLVSGGSAYLLDFGLAVASDDDVNLSGTLAYIAPEAITGKAITPAADLYSVGVMAYEMFARRHPFAADSVPAMINLILNDRPDPLALDVPDSLKRVILQLLAKDPTERYADATAALFALSDAAGLPRPTESQEIRESYLKAARFVGRAREMAILEEALERAQAGQGTTWLVGGESGIGKSRLLDELRTHALVSGVTVLRGQAVNEGGVPFQAWINPLRSLALRSEIDPTQQATLQAIIPDLPALLRRPALSVPDLDPKGRKQAIITTVLELFAAQTVPILLILEDLHWAGEGIELLDRLSRQTRDQQLLIVGSYRSDERPELPRQLEQARVLTLDRLSKAQIEELSTSMLGQAGQRGELVDLLNKETEGNLFFLIETVRILAEEAGALDQVGKVTLPQSVFVGGIRDIVRRRLSRVPDRAQTLLKLAAVAARQLDLTLLGELVDRHKLPDLDAWLNTCANAAVISLQDGQWQFAHDKLRETILQDLHHNTRRAAHRKVAEAIEALYGDQAEYAVALAGHWREAGKTDRELAALDTALDHHLSLGNLQQAEQLAQRGLSILRSGDEQGRLSYLARLGNIQMGFSRYDHAHETLTRAFDLANRLDDRREKANLLIAIGGTHFFQGRFDQADSYFEDALDLMRTLADEKGIAQALNSRGNVAFIQGNLEQAEPLYQESLTIRRRINDRAGLSKILSNLGGIASWYNNHHLGIKYYSEAAGISRELGDKRAVAHRLNNLAVMYRRAGDLAEAEAVLRDALSIAQQTGETFQVAMALNHLANLAIDRQDFGQAKSLHQRSLSLRREIKDVWGMTFSLAFLALIANREGDYDLAERYLSEALELAQGSNIRQAMVDIYREMARMALGRGDLDGVRKHLVLALQTADEINNDLERTNTLVAVAELFGLIGWREQAAALVGFLNQHEATDPVESKRLLTKLDRQLQAVMDADAYLDALESYDGATIKAIVGQAVAHLTGLSTGGQG